MTNFDATIQWTDTSKDPGYQETREDIVIAASDVDDAIAKGREARPNVTRVKVHGVDGTSLTFDGVRTFWSSAGTPVVLGGSARY